MEKHIVTIRNAEFVTHNVRRFTLDKPEGYTFTSGQATDVAINQPGLEEELRPFTFTCLNTDDHLEFTIKIYTDHNGVTNKLGKLNIGDELIIHDTWGAITYKGPGIFIAGGAGLTPFISILRQLKKDGELDGQTLLFANKTEDDIIIKDELDQMLGDRHIDIISNPKSGEGKRIDKKLLSQYITGSGKHYYICGPDQFVNDIKNDLIELGVPDDKIVIEQ